MRIKEIKIQGFRSIYNQTIKVDNFNIFVGLNDSGKSNILKALNLFFNNETGRGEKFSFQHDFNIQSKEDFERDKISDKQRKQAKKITIELTFLEQSGVLPVWRKEWRENGLHANVQFDKKLSIKERATLESGFKKRSGTPDKLSKIQYIYVPAVKSSEFIGSLIGRLSDVLSERASQDIRTTALGFENSIQKRITSVFKGIEKELDITSSLRLPDSLNAIFSQMQFSDDRNIGLSRRGDGVRARHIPILLNAISTLHWELKSSGETYDHFIWGYEEPENNVEIKKCYEMAKQLHEKSANHQIFLTTHSPAFYSFPLKLNENWKQYENGICRYYAEYEYGKTEYTPPENAKLDDNFLLPMVSELMDKKNNEIDEKNKIIDYLNKNDAFSKPCIFVEGESDEIIFKKAISLFFPFANEKINIKRCNGVHGVCESLLAWRGYFERLKIDDSNIKKAYGYFDSDLGGEEQKKRFENFYDNTKIAIAIEYPKEGRYSHIYELYQHCRIKIPSILEYFYSPSFWELAEEKKMLTGKSLAELERNLGRKHATAVIRNNEYINELLPEKFKNNKGISLLITHEFGKDKKVPAAKLIRDMDEYIAKEYLLIFAKSIKNTIGKLLPDEIENNKDLFDDSYE